jgi:hypothetical protein
MWPYSERRAILDDLRLAELGVATILSFDFADDAPALFRPPPRTASMAWYSNSSQRRTCAGSGQPAGEGEMRPVAEDRERRRPD